MDPDFVLIRIHSVEKRPVRIRTKGPGSETLIYNIIIPQLWEQVQRFLLHLDPRSIHHSPAISSQQPASSLSSNQLSSSCTPQTQVKINQFALEEVWSVRYRYHIWCARLFLVFHSHKFDVLQSRSFWAELIWQCSSGSFSSVGELTKIVVNFNVGSSKAFLCSKQYFSLSIYRTECER